MSSIASVPKKNSEENIVDVDVVYQRRCLEESGQWLENVDRTHLDMASCKLALKNQSNFWFPLTEAFSFFFELMLNLILEIFSSSRFPEFASEMGRA